MISDIYEIWTIRRNFIFVCLSKLEIHVLCNKCMFRLESVLCMVLINRIHSDLKRGQFLFTDVFRITFLGDFYGSNILKHYPGDSVACFIEHIWKTCAWWLRIGVYETRVCLETLHSWPIKSLGLSLLENIDSWTHCGVVDNKNANCNF